MVPSVTITKSNDSLKWLHKRQYSNVQLICGQAFPLKLYSGESNKVCTRNLLAEEITVHESMHSVPSYMHILYGQLTIFSHGHIMVNVIMAYMTCGVTEDDVQLTEINCMCVEALLPLFILPRKNRHAL